MLNIKTMQRACECILQAGSKTKKKEAGSTSSNSAQLSQSSTLEIHMSVHVSHVSQVPVGVYCTPAVNQEHAAKCPKAA